MLDSKPIEGLAVDVLMYLNVFGARVNGYEITAALEISSEFYTYNLLGQLERRGLIRLYLRKGSRDAHYVLTDNGKELANEIARQWREAS